MRHIHIVMTLKLDPATTQLLDKLANAWGISKEEAARRAIKEAGAAVPGASTGDRLAALRELQRRLRLSPASAEAWLKTIQAARR